MLHISDLIWSTVRLSGTPNQRSPYETLLAATQLPTLEKRRTKSSLCHFFKIMNKLTHYPDPPIMQWESQHITRSSAPNRLIVPHSNTAYRQRSFFPSVIAIWNQLPKEAKLCQLIQMFVYVIVMFLLLSILDRIHHI